MTAEYTINTDLSAVSPAALAEVVRRAPLSDREPYALYRAFAASHACVFAWREGELVGCARAVSDGVYYATIFDVCVLPEHQGKGVGRAIVEAMVARLPFEKVFLTAVPGKEGFYAKFGFMKHNHAMGCYAPAVIDRALSRGILSPHSESSFGSARAAS